MFETSLNSSSRSEYLNMDWVPKIKCSKLDLLVFLCSFNNFQDMINFLLCTNMFDKLVDSDFSKPDSEMTNINSKYPVYI